jgi:hypothetical protein
MEKVATGGQGRSALTEACCCAARDDPSIAEQRVRLAIRMRRGERVGIFMIFMRRGTWIKAGRWREVD